MVYEVEVKFRLRGRDEFDDLARRLEQIGAKFVEEVEEVDTYFAHPCRDFAKTDEALRLRSVRRGTVVESILTYKGPRLGAEGKTREEISVSVDNPERLTEILVRLGFRIVATVKKNRRVYTYENFTIALDEVEKLGYFTEIESIASSEDLIEQCVQEILNFASSLGLDSSRIEKKTYLELLLETATPV